MKRTFLAKRKGLLSSVNFSWGVLALVFAVLMLLMRLLAPNIFWQAFAPAFRGADALAAQSHLLFSSFENNATLFLKNEFLIKENVALINENRALTAKERALSALFKAPSNTEIPEDILASVVTRPPESPYDTLVIAAGMEMGVTVGMEVFGIGSVPVGIVSEVLPDFSRVTLFSSPRTVVHGWVGHAKFPITIQGAGGGAMRASLARSAGIGVGDTVFAPGPGALPIGTVTHIADDPTAPEVVLRITPAVNLFSITWVFLRDTGTNLSNAFLQATSTP